MSYSTLVVFQGAHSCPLGVRAFLQPRCYQQATTIWSRQAASSSTLISACGVIDPFGGTAPIVIAHDTAFFAQAET